jgi:hypothetical protein
MFQTLEHLIPLTTANKLLLVIDIPYAKIIHLALHLTPWWPLQLIKTLKGQQFKFVLHFGRV